MSADPAPMLLAYGNRTDGSTLSNGAAVPTMPLTNLQNRQLGVVWRTPDLSPDSSKFDVALPDHHLIRVVALANHNLSIDAKMRLRLNDDPTFPVEAPIVGGGSGTPIGLMLTITGGAGGGGTTPTVDYYDTGWIDVWPVIYADGVLEWEDDNWWSGKYTQEQIENEVHSVKVLLPDGLRPLYLRWEFDDRANPDGYVQAGRLFMAPAWQPLRNANFGATLGWSTNTDVQVAISGAKFFDTKTPFRVGQFKFDMMTEDEGLSNPFEIMRRSGVDKELFFMWNPDDTIHATRRQFLCTLQTLSPLEFPEGLIDSSLRTSLPMAVEELVP